MENTELIRIDLGENTSNLTAEEYISEVLKSKHGKTMELKEVPKIEKFLFTINLTRHMSDGVTEPTGVDIKVQLSPSRSNEELNMDIIRILLSAVDSMAFTAIFTDAGIQYQKSPTDL